MPASQFIWFPIRDPFKGTPPPSPPKKAFKGLFVTKKGFLRGLPPPNYKALKDPYSFPYIFPIFSLKKAFKKPFKKDRNPLKSLEKG